MSFVVGGITFYEPGDHTLITNPASIQGIMAYNNNALYRLDKSAFSLATHLHDGQTIKPGKVDFFGRTDNYLTSASNGFIQIRGSGTSYASITVSGSAGSIIMYAPHPSALAAQVVGGRWQMAGGGTIYPAYGVTLPNSSDKGSVHAYAFVLWASDAKDKKDIAKIKDPKEILKKVEGITYTDTEDTPRVGITAQDLEATNLPGAVDKSPEGEYIGINPIVLLYPLLEEVKALRAELDAVKEKVK